MEGRIQKALSGFYYVHTGGVVLTCRARGKFRREGISPLVGDRVEVRDLGGGEGVAGHGATLPTAADTADPTRASSCPGADAAGPETGPACREGHVARASRSAATPTLSA